MSRYALSLLLRWLGSLQAWYWDNVALAGAACLQRARQAIVRRLAKPG